MLLLLTLFYKTKEAAYLTEITRASYHVQCRKVTEHDEDREHRPIWRNEDETATERKSDV